MKYVLLILLFISTAVSAQVVQETNDSRASRRVIVKNGLLLPKVCNPTTAWPDLLNYNGNQGAIVFDSCNNKIKWWNGSFWDSTGASGGSGDYVDTIYRKAGQDSIFFTINGGPERAIKDSTGGGGGGFSLDSLAVVNRGLVGTSLTQRNIVSRNSTSGGGATGVGANVYNHNIYLGYNSGAGAKTSFANIAIGGQVMELDSTGSENVGIGALALQDLQGGLRNTAIGVSSLTNLTNGGGNFGLGYRAGFTLTTGDNNVAIGTEALELNSTGNGSIAIGNRTLESYLGSDAVGIGTNALLVTTGADNTGIGRQAGISNTTGTRSTYIGSLSGNGATGSANVMIGYYSGRLTTGAMNVAIGASTSNNAETMRGSGNTLSVAVGSSAMNYNNGSNASFIGADAGRGASGTPHTGQYNNGFGYRANYDIGGAVTGASNTVIGDRIALPSRTSNEQFVFGINGVNYLTRFTGGGWLINYTSSAVTTQTASTALEVNGTTGAVLFPRLTTTQRDALTATNGMVIYNTTTDKLQVYAAATWVDLH